MKKSMFTAFAVGLCLSANVMAQVPSYVPTNGLVGWWPFNGNANDESGNGNNGTVNGATLTTDRNGVANKAYSFDGVDDYIDIGDWAIGGEISIAVWVNYSAFNPMSRVINLSNGQYVNPIIFSNSQSTNSGYITADCTPTTVTSDLFLIGNWDFFVVKFSANLNCSIFKNGELVNNFPMNCNIPTVVRLNQFLGKSDYLVDGYFNGNLDDIGIWNRSLSECEIQDLYNSQINSVAGSIAVSPNSASLGSNVTLSTATNSTNIQWQNNPLNNGWQNVPSNSTYSGGTTNTLTVNNVQLANHNQPFRVIASAGNCSDTSNVATIQIADTCITSVTVYDTLLTTVTDTLIINTTLGLPSPNNENTILIYPNPASDHITIDNGNYTAMVGYTIKIENNAGQQVFQSLINQAQFYVDLSTWSGNGLYFVHLIDAQGNTVTVRKIVLQ